MNLLDYSDVPVILPPIVFLCRRKTRSTFASWFGLPRARLTVRGLGWAFAAFAGCTLCAGSTDKPQLRIVPSPESGWPQWKGVRRDGRSGETNLLSSWPAGGPPLLWKAGDIGRGYSAPIITGGRVYITGERGDELRVFALDFDGRSVWESGNGRSWKGQYPGARASCTFSAGRLYHLNAHGRLACLDASDGREVWAVDVLDRFGGKNITWALSENVLVDGERVIVTAGGNSALIAALDKRTGATVWASEPLTLGPSDDPAMQRLAEPTGEADQASYGSPILVEYDGRRLIVGCSMRHMFAVDADNGLLVWTWPLPTRYLVISATPLVVGDSVFVTAPDTDAGGLFRLKPLGDGQQVERVWGTEFDTCHGGWAIVGDMIFGAWHRAGKGWAAIDTETGAVRWRWKDMAKGSVIWAADRLYCLAEDGEMALLKAGTDGVDVRGRFRLVQERVNDAWTHPVILRGRLYIRYHDDLFCYDVRGQR